MGLKHARGRKEGFEPRHVLRLANGSMWAVGPCGDAVMVAVDLAHVGVVTMLLAPSEAAKLGDLLDRAALEVKEYFEHKPMRGDDTA